ncbi:MAG TPA: PIN domain-containing protein [Candidatus Eisenbacteria bacterium]
MTRLVIDASVWVAALDASDEFSAPSRAFLDAATRQRVSLEIPAHAPIEIACALARRLGNARVARELGGNLVRMPGIRLHALTAELLERAGFLGTESMLRSGDAIYAALAQQIEARVITWDGDLHDRAEGVTPTEWMATEAG